MKKEELLILIKEQLSDFIENEYSEQDHGKTKIAASKIKELTDKYFDNIDRELKKVGSYVRSGFVADLKKEIRTKAEKLK